MLQSLLHDLNPWWSDPGVRRAERYPVRRTLQPRALAQVLRFDDRRAVVIEGPRQVGKTVLLHQVVDDLLDNGWPAANITYFEFSDDRIAGSLNPRDVVDAAPAHADPARPRIFLFDEIGRAKKWAEWLKQTVDRSQHRMLVTDSASTLLREGARESGQGRWDLMRMEGLTFFEYVRLTSPTQTNARDTLRTFPGLFERYLARGGYPEHATTEFTAEARERIRVDIVDRAIRRDLSRLYDDARVKDLFVYLVQNSGGIFDSRSRAQDLDADYRSIESWRGGLEDALLLAALPPRAISRKARTRLRAKPKLYASDHGLVVGFSDLPSPLNDPETRGRIYETMVFRHLRELSSDQRVGLGYLEAGGHEIDFVFDGRSGPVAVEVTSRESFQNKVGALHYAAKELKARRLLLVHGGPIEEQRADMLLVPAAMFALDPQRYLEEADS